MIGVEGVDAVVLGGDVEHVVRTLSGDFDVGYVERLGVNRAVHFEGAELAEVLGIDVLRRQDFFGDCGVGAGVVVLGGGDLRERRFRHQQRKQDNQLEAGLLHFLRICRLLRCLQAPARTTFPWSDTRCRLKIYVRAALNVEDYSFAKHAHAHRRSRARRLAGCAQIRAATVRKETSRPCAAWRDATVCRFRRAQ